LFGLNSSAALIMALLLSQGGEFGFVLFSASQNALLIEPAAASLFGAVITLSMASTPFLMILAGRLAARRRSSDVALEDPALAASGAMSSSLAMAGLDRPSARSCRPRVCP
jgi:glutathione-regulated potassium-efflux system protein KefB